MFFVDETRPRIVNGWQLIAIVVMFLSIIYFLHVDQKTFYRKLLTSENSNYDLTIAYLRNLVRLEPENAANLYEFAKVLIKKGNYDLAEVTLTALESLSTSDPLKKKAILLKYEMLKRQYYMSDDPKVRKKLFNKMVKIYDEIVHSDFFEKISLEEMKRWLDESWFLKRSDLRLEILVKMVQKDPINVKLNETLFYTALNHQRKDLALKALRHLQKGIDQLAADAYRRRLELIVEGYYALGEVDDATSLLIRAFEKEKKTKYLFKAIQLFVWSKKYQKALSLARKYEPILMKNRKDAEKLLDLYLESNRVDEARRLSLQLLKKYGQ